MGIIYKEFIARFRDDHTRTFCLNEEPGSSYSYNFVNTYLIPVSIEFFGIPFGLSDIDEDQLCKNDYSKTSKVASLFGWMILCCDMLYHDYDPLEVCDDENADLEYTISALQDEGRPLNDDSGNSMQNVFYIHEIEMVEHDDNIKKRIIDELPFLLRDFLHVEPGILAYCASPIESDWEPENAERSFELQKYAANQFARRFGYDSDEQTTQSNKKVVPFLGNYQFSDDEIKMITGRRNSSSVYPEYLKKKDEWDLFESAGFEEAGNSRLLYKRL